MYLSLYWKGYVCERELETEQNCNILTPTLMTISIVSFLFSKAAQPEAQGPTLLYAGFLYRILSPASLQTHWGSWGPLLPGGGFLYHILSLTHPIANSLGVPRAPSAGWWLSLLHLVSNSSDLQLTDFLSSQSYIIVQSPTQSLEWHVWSSSSGNNCHAVHTSLSSGASVYECTMGFYLVPYCQPSPPTQFLLITAFGMCHFLPVHHFGMACLAGLKVNIQHTHTHRHTLKRVSWNFPKLTKILS